LKKREVLEALMEALDIFVREILAKRLKLIKGYVYFVRFKPKPLRFLLIWRPSERLGRHLPLRRLCL